MEELTLLWRSPPIHFPLHAYMTHSISYGLHAFAWANFFGEDAEGGLLQQQWLLHSVNYFHFYQPNNYEVLTLGGKAGSVFPPK